MPQMRVKSFEDINRNYCEYVRLVAEFLGFVKVALLQIVDLLYLRTLYRQAHHRHSLQYTQCTRRPTQLHLPSLGELRSRGALPSLNNSLEDIGR